MSLKAPYLTEPERYLDGHSCNKSGREYDSQRQKLYDAQKWAPEGQRFQAVSDMQCYVDDMIGRPWWKRRFSLSQVRVKDGRGRRRAGARSYITSGNGQVSLLANPQVKMPRHARYERCLIHEVVHCLVLPPHAAHGRLYAKAYLELVRWRMGGDAYEKLLKGYREENVKYHPHRTAKVEKDALKRNGSAAARRTAILV